MEQFEQARTQMHLYQRGALAGFELTSFRYAILVSRQDLKIAIPDDLDQGGVVYRHINVVLDPLTPSKRARALAKNST